MAASTSEISTRNSIPASMPILISALGHLSVNLSLSSTCWLIFTSNASVAFGNGIRGSTSENEQYPNLDLL